MNKKSKKNSLIDKYKKNKTVFNIYLILRFLVIGTMIAQFFNKNYENVFLCVLTLFLFMVPSFLEKSLKIEFPTALQIIMLLFIFAAEILGEIREYYIIFPYWDTLLHTLNGFLAAAIGFSLVDMLNNSTKIKFSLSPIFMAIVGFCFSMTIGVVWEFFEFSMDYFFCFDTQKDTIINTLNTVYLDPNKGNTVVNIPITKTVINDSIVIDGYLDIGIIDTIMDLFVNFIGATVFSILGFIYFETKGKIGFIARNLIPYKKEKLFYEDKEILENKKFIENLKLIKEEHNLSKEELISIINKLY